MNKNVKKISLLLLTLALCLGFYSTVKATGQSPIVDAGNDLYLVSGQTAVLNGTASDPDGGVLTYAWHCNGGILSAFNVLQPTYTAPNIIAFHNYDKFTCTLTATDASGLSNSDSIKVYVNYDNAVNVPDINVKTTAATNIAKNQATLNGIFSSKNNSVTSVWFQYGFSSNYGNETTHQAMTGSSGSFTQSLSSLFLNATYHYRAVAQDSAGNKFYGQNMTFQTQMNVLGNGLTVSKKVINLTSGNLGWSESINAKPSDILSFSITLQTDTDLTNVVVKDILPSNFIYNNNLLINASRNYSENLLNGINIGSIKAGEVAIISYQAKVAIPANNFGTTTLNVGTIVDTDQTNEVTDSTVILVNNSQVSGVSTVSPTDLSTGQTNNLFVDSFFFPMLLITFGAWFYFSGRVYSFADWLNKYL